MEIKEGHIKVLKKLVKNEIIIEKERLKTLEYLKNTLENKEFIETLLNSNHYEKRIKELALKEEILKVLEGK